MADGLAAAAGTAFGRDALAALATAEIDADWARQAATRIHDGFFANLNNEANQ